MKIWLIRANEIMPLNQNTRLMRMGLLADELCKNGHDVTWFVSTFDHYRKEQYFDEDTVVEINKNYRLNFIYAKGYKTNISLARVNNHFKIGKKIKVKMKELEKPDLIFSSFPTIELAYEAVKYGKKNNIPVIVDIRDLWPDIFEHNLKGIMKVLALPYIYYLNRETRMILSNCYHITGASSLMVDWALKKVNRKKDKMDKPFYIGYKKVESSNKNDVDKKISQVFKNDYFNICFFATINNQFNYDFVVEIAESLKNDKVNIIICGDGPQFEEFKEKCGDSNNIKLLGWCDSNSLQYVIDNSQVGLAPYKNTFDFQMSVSNKFCEYLSYGLPIILTSEGYMKSIIEKNNIGIGSMDAKGIRDYVVKLKENKELYSNVSKNATKLYNKCFNAEKIYPEMVKYLVDVKEEYNK